MSQSKLIRSFIAIAIDNPLQKVLHKISLALQKKENCAQVRWIPVENFHITLRFLGERTPEKVEEVKSMMGSALENVSIFNVEPGKIILFPPHTHPHIIAQTFLITAELANIVQIIEKTVNQCGFALEERAFLPHVTLGRFQGHYELDLSAVATPELPKQLVVKEVILYGSELKETGSVYTALQRFKLQP